MRSRYPGGRYAGCWPDGAEVAAEVGWGPDGTGYAGCWPDGVEVAA